MRYLGSKAKLIDFIHTTLNKYDIHGHVFCDLFAGTSSVADSFKNEYEVIANDFMYYSYCFSNAKLLNTSIPSFKEFENKYKCNIFNWLNEKDYIPNNHFFIYQNYSPKGNRMFFTEDNAIKIDGIRDAIEQLRSENIIKNNEYYFLIASLLDSVTRYSNTSGTYEAFFKFWDNRSLKEFKIEPIEINECNYIKSCTIYRTDSNELIRNVSGDILYLDPPYTVTQYASAYNILETIALRDEPKIKGVAGKRGKGSCVSLYSYKRKAKEEFEDLFRQAQFTHIIMSYSNQGVVPLNELIELAQKFAKDGVVHVEYMEYQEYQNHRSSNKRNGERLMEVLIFFQKDLSIIKSPLNYAGSKDRLFLNLQKYFPKHVGTFVDVMGGAFNVGMNVYATDSIIYNDNNPYVYGIVQWLLSKDKNKLINTVEEIIKDFCLEKGKDTAYNELRNYYNQKKSAIEILFVLHMYAFQNYLRFNKKLEFNTPIGVAGYSDDLKSRIEQFIPKTHNVEMSNVSFKCIEWDSFPQDTLFYFDPPYTITKAAYNDGKRGLEGWSVQDDEILFATLNYLDSKGYKFLMSNVKEHRGRRNDQLIEWVNSKKYYMLDMGISGWRYAKNEIIVTNFKSYGNINTNK